MNKEKIILSFAAALIGIVFAVGVFYFYQSSKKINPSDVKKITINNPSPTPKSSIFLTVETPKDEQVVDKRTIAVTGKTVPDANLIVVTQSTQQSGVAASNGNFSMDITLDTGDNVIEITAVAKNGEEVSVKKVVTFSTESF